MQSQVQDDFLGNVIQLGDRMSTVELAAVNDAVPIGALISWPFSTSALLPSNWLFCQGQAIDRVTYGSLFSLTNNGSAPFGVGDGATTFNLPNYPNAFPSVIDTWTGVSYGTGYADYGAGYGGVQYWKDQFGLVHLQGLIGKTSAFVAGETMFTLPVGFRPASFIPIFNLHGSIATAGAKRVDIAMNGTVSSPESSAGAGAYLSFSGVVFDSGVLPTQDPTMASIAIKAA